MQSNCTTCRTRIHSACSNLIVAIKGATLPDTGVPKWKPGWLIRRGADVRMMAEVVVEMWPVAEEAKEEEENRRGCREERETDGGSWWSVGGCVGFLWWR